MDAIRYAQQALDEKTRANERLIAAAQNALPPIGVTYVQRMGDLGPHTALYPSGHAIRCYSPTPEQEISDARSAYANGEIEIDEFERRVSRVR